MDATTTVARLLIRLLLGFAAVLGVQNAAHAEAEVDLALVLAVDVSYSMDADEQRLQRDGFVQAFRSSQVQDAVRKGAVGRIAVTYIEWSGEGQQSIIVPWTVVDGTEAANAFSDRLAKNPVRRLMYTSISGAIDFGLKLFGESGVTPLRRVIDVSGDGPNNAGRMVTLASR